MKISFKIPLTIKTTIHALLVVAYTTAAGTIISVIRTGGQINTTTLKTAGLAALAGCLGYITKLLAHGSSMEQPEQPDQETKSIINEIDPGPEQTIKPV